MAQGHCLSFIAARGMLYLDVCIRSVVHYNKGFESTVIEERTWHSLHDQ